MRARHPTPLAVHEAAHAVVSWKVFGVPVDQVTIEPSAHCAGHCAFAIGLADVEVDAIARIYLAGQVGEWLGKCAKRGDRLPSAQFDYDTARLVLATATRPVGSRDHDRVVLAVELMTEVALAKEWECVLRLARALDKYGTLRYLAIERLVFET